MKEAVEEGRGRRYKEGDQMVEKGMIFESSWEIIFLEEGRKEGVGTEGKKTGGGG